MNSYLKRIFLTSLLALPLAGAASAEHYRGHDDLIERRQMLTEELRVNREQYRTAVQNGNWDRAREERREIARNLQQLSDTNYQMAWYEANPGATLNAGRFAYPNDYHYVTIEDGDGYHYVTVPDNNNYDEYYYRRTVTTVPGYTVTTTPGYRRVYDADKDRYYYVRIR